MTVFEYVPTAAAIVLATSLGCTQIPKTEPYAPNSGIQTCSRLAKAAANRSTEEFLTGTVMAVAGAAGVGAGIIMGPDNSADAAWHERSRYLLVIAPSAIVAGLGIGVVSRSQHTERLADQSAAALADGKNEADPYLYYQCVSARADWSGDRNAMMRVEISLLKENVAAAMAAQQTAAAAETQAAAAAIVAAEAKATAVKAAQTASASAAATRDLADVTEKLMQADPKKKDGGTASGDAGARSDGSASKPLEQR
jgi:hypothetical protein